MLIDLHTHTTPKSWDSSLEPETLLSRAKEVGLDGICLTEHDDFWDPAILAAWSRRYDLLVLPGCEVNTEAGHLLVFGLDRYIFGMHRASFVHELAAQVEGAIVVAHPYRGRYRGENADDLERYGKAVERACRDHVFSLATAVETLNGRGSEAENRFSQAMHDHLGMPGTGASDAHQVTDIGTFATEFDAPVRGLEELIRELRAGRYRPAVLRAPWATGAPVP